MLIGSSRSTTILASRFSSLLLIISLATACGNSHPPPAINDTTADFLCEHSCGKKTFKMFTGRNVHIEIEPTGAMSQLFYNLDPSLLMSEPTILRDSVVVTGQANVDDAYLINDKTDHDNQASFSDIIAIPLINNINFLSPRIQIKKAHLIKPEFRIELLSDLAYTLILNPAGHLDRAPIHMSPGIIAEGKTINFSIRNDLIQIRGHLVAEDAELFAQEDTPVMHARIMHGSRLASSVATVDQTGEFIVELTKPLFSDQIGEPLVLVIEPISELSPLPRLKQRLDPDSLDIDIDLGDINLGTLKEPISVTIDVHGSDDTAIGNAFIYLQAKVGTGEVLIKKQVDESGTTKFSKLFEGKYDIAVVPPFESPFAMRVIKEVDFDSSEFTEVSIDLHKREPLTAQVLGPEGQAVPGAQIELSRIGEPGNLASEDIYDDMLFKLTAITNQDGRVCHRRFGYKSSENSDCARLVLDEGRYLAHIIPPAGTELSHTWITFDFPENHELTISLDEPEVLMGQILNRDLSPVSHAFITIYLAEPSMHNQPKMIGNAITDVKGFYKAFVSAP